tara:strand:+ start:543 stop:1610 length:1068 start_codon:yes stop_codon:yes gene_type:complete
MGISLDTQATRSNLTSVDTTLSANISATQNYIPVASTTNFSTSVVAEIESTNEVVSFTDLSSNQYLNSEDVSSWLQNQVTVTTDSTTAPNGTTTADKVVPNTNNTLHFVYQNNISITGPLTFSVFAKAAGYNFIKLYSGGSSVCSANFNLATGTVGATGGSGFNSARITDFGDGWYRCEVTSNTSVSGGTTAGGVYVTSVPSSPVTSGFSEAGDGTSGAFLWGGQVEAGTSASTYLPTLSSARVGLTGVTRGVNGTTAQAASSGASIQQLPYALNDVDMAVRLEGLNVSTDGTGAGRFTLADNNGDTLFDLDIPDGKKFNLDFGGGIIFPNGVYVSNTDNIAGYTLFTSKYGSNS